jgi:MFS family permease
MPTLFQRFDQVVRPQGRVFYGWWIVSSASGIQMLSSLLWMHSYGAYVVLLQAEFGWSKTLVAGAFALTRIESGILGPLQGWLVDRFGPRLILQIGTVIYGIGFMLFSQVDNAIEFYLTFALIAVGSSLGGFATVMVAVVSWFSQHRSKAVALSQLGFSIGGLCVPLVVFVLESYGWRVTAFASGVAVLVIGLPLGQVIRHRPDQYSDVVDGIRAPSSAASDKRSTGTVQRRDHTAREALRTRAFWFISLGHALALLTVSTLMVHLISHLTEGPLAFSLTAAGAVVAFMTATQFAGQLTGGFFGDRLNKRIVCAGCLAAHATGLTLVAFASAPWITILGVFVHGLGWGVRGPLMTAMRADYFGASSFGTIMGFSSLIVMLGMSLGPIIAGVLADVTGNYQLGFVILAAGSMLGSVCFLAATPPPHPATTR